MFLVESNEDTPLCPVCGSGMKLYDHRKRIMKQYDQDDEYVIVPRYRCLKNSCNKIHTALPSCLIPHKHYAVHIIEETIDEYNSESLMTANYPCESTCIRWIRWMKQLNSQIDAHLKSIGSIREHIGFSILERTDSLLQQERVTGPGWLYRVIAEIYNSGRFIPSAFPPALTSVAESKPLSFSQDKEENSHEQTADESKGSKSRGKVSDDLRTFEKRHRYSENGSAEKEDSS